MGIGKAVASSLVEAGANLILFSRSEVIQFYICSVNQFVINKFSTGQTCRTEKRIIEECKYQNYL